MKLQNEKVRSDKLYRVVYMPDVDKYVMACVVPLVAEFNAKGTKSDRFFFSDKKEENKS